MLNRNKILSKVHVASPRILNGFIIFTAYRQNKQIYDKETAARKFYPTKK